MKVDYLQVIGVIFAIAAIVVALIMINEQEFPLFKYAESRTLINVGDDVGERSGIFLWKNRSLDLLIQAFVLLASAIGCVALFRAERW
ncbi:MAG: hypothetical protein J7J19_05840 [Thaumarchaeota archaeon]|nr:hypothetical protein [Nitrososphaerota archaeon]